MGGLARVAIVTGGGRGIGRGIALGLAGVGVSVAVTARSRVEIDETVSLIRESGGAGLACQADVTSEADAARVLRTVEAELGPVGLLINNAGVGGPIGPFWEVDLNEWRECIEINLLGPATMTRVLLPAMLARNEGRIINVASRAALHGGPYLNAYTASKTALARFSESLAVELRGTGVSVFAIHPGTIHTRMEDRVVRTEIGRKWLPQFAAMVHASAIPVEQCADFCIRLASGVADVLSGRFLDVADDLSAMVTKAEEITTRNLYTLQLSPLR